MKKLLLLLTLPAVAIMIPSLVSADNSTTEPPTPSSSQIACMVEQGFTKPSVKPATPPTREQREKMKAAARACGLTKKLGDSQGKTVKPKRGPNAALTTTQIACMVEQGFTKPSVKPATPPTREQREKMKAAARACGLTKKLGDSQGKTVKPKTVTSTASQTPTVNSSSASSPNTRASR